MSDASNLYARPNLVLEPLCSQWYAWAYLIAPAPAAMYVANLHVKVMESFVTVPQVHVAAMKDPAMRAGPFIGYDESRVADVRELLRRTSTDQAHMLELAEAIRSFDAVLLQEASGYSLEPLYAKVPDPLRGYVELVYDLDNRPSMRFIDGLLYRSRYYHREGQTVSLYLTETDQRALFFSTPRLPSPERVQLGLPFASEAIDALSSAKRAATTLGALREQLAIPPDREDLFRSFLTAEAPPPPAPYDEEAVRVRYFGHACVLMESRGVSILTDPVVSYRYPTDLARYTHEDLPETLDYVLITHNHQDHCLLESLLPLRHRMRTIVVPKSSGGRLADVSLKLLLQNCGFRNVVDLDEMEGMPIEGGEIMALPFLGEHADLDIRTKAAYLVRLRGRSLLFAADSNNIEPALYGHVHRAIGDIDVLFIGMECDGAPLTWVYGPLLTRPLPRGMDRSRRYDGSDFPKAMDLVERLRPRQVYVYAMGQEPWLTFLTAVDYEERSRPIVESDRLLGACTARGIVCERLFARKELFLEPRA